MKTTWLNEQIRSISKEIDEKKPKNYDTLTMIKCLIFLIPLLFFAITHADCLQCPVCTSVIEIDVIPKEASWTCKRCKQHNWQQYPDWKGDYYCGACGTRKGDG